MNNPSPCSASEFSAFVVKHGYSSRPLLTVTRVAPAHRFMSWVRDADNDVISIPVVEDGDDPLLDPEIVEEVIRSLEDQ